MVKINLLSVKELMRKRMLIQHSVMGTIPIILAIILILLFEFSITARIDKVNGDIKVTKNKITKLDKIIGQINKLKKDKKALEEKLDVISRLNKNRSLPVHILDELSQNIPEKLWLINLEQSNTRLKLKGVGLDNETIVTFIKNLKKSKYFGKIDLNLTKQFKRKGYKLKEFEIICRTQIPI